MMCRSGAATTIIFLALIVRPSLVSQSALKKDGNEEVVGDGEELGEESDVTCHDHGRARDLL